MYPGKSTETYPAEFLQNRGKEKLISARETVNGTSVLCAGKTAKKRPVCDRSFVRSRLMQTYWRLAGGMIPFIRRYSTICP
jgi:hypothetical protein